MNDRDFIVIEIQNQQMVQVLQSAWRNILQLILRDVELRQSFAWCEKGNEMLALVSQKLNDKEN